MQVEKYRPNALSVSALLGLIESKDIAIPEIQRPFVWKNKQVRDLLDSLYKGYPTGYIILWKNPSVRLKDGTYSAGKKILIDGQQRITALMTAIAGMPIVNSDYKKCRVKIAFNPFAALSDDKDAEVFAVQDQSHLKSKRWIPDIAEVFKTGFNTWNFVNTYCSNNPDMKAEDFNEVLMNLKYIGNRQIGVIELEEHLDIDIVTDIFIRINSKGTPLSQGDFVMSKIASDEKYGGNMLRKAIDYFSHLSIDPSFYEFLSEHDTEFVESQYFKKLAWLKDDKDTIFDPECDDIIRIAFMYKFRRAKLSELVSLLSGRNFKTREYNEEIIEDTYQQLIDGVNSVISENNFTQFMIAIKGAGFISSDLINSNMALDFAYTLYLILKESHEVSVSEVKRIVQKWYVLSVLTGRYSTSPETAFARDLRLIEEGGVVKTLKGIEAATLSDNFWNIALVQDLSYTSTNNPTYLVYLAAQAMNAEISLLSTNVTVRELILLGGDIHHIFPKEYLKEKGFEKNKYNQEGNYVYLDRPVNQSIGKKSPKEYFRMAVEQCETKKVACGAITDIEQLKKNLEINCVPYEVVEMEYDRYDEFLAKRRSLMAKKIKNYYESL
jgi:hypothetical protein